MTSPQEYIDARAKMVRETTDVLAKLSIWELTNSTDLRRYERIRHLMQMAYDVESRYGTRVADVDMDRHGLAGQVVTRVVDDAVLRRNPDYVPFAIDAGPRVARVLDPVGDEMEALARSDDEALAGAIAEAQLRTANQALDRLPAVVADAVIDRVNRNPHWEGGDGARYGAPYEEPPAGPFAAIAQQMPHMRPVVAGIEAAMAQLRPDPVTQLANRLSALAAARDSLTALASGIDTSVIDRQIAKTQSDLDQLESDNVPDARPATPPQHGETT